MDTIAKHYEVIAKHYPKLNVTQLGMVCLMLGSIRASMGHENASSTIQNYIHPTMLSDDVRECLNFLEREILGIKRSKIDIDFWKRGKEGSFRRYEDKIEV